MTSFERSHGLTMPVFSAAVYQPKGYDYPKVDWTDIRDPDGKWMRPRDFIFMDGDPLFWYHGALWNLYEGRYPEAHAWARGLVTDVALCCWCPYDRAAQRQLHEHGSFVCHTAVLGEFIEAKLGLRVWYDSDRRRMKELP